MQTQATIKVYIAAFRAGSYSRYKRLRRALNHSFVHVGLRFDMQGRVYYWNCGQLQDDTSMRLEPPGNFITIWQETFLKTDEQDFEIFQDDPATSRRLFQACLRDVQYTPKDISEGKDYNLKKYSGSQSVESLTSMLQRVTHVIKLRKFMTCTEFVWERAWELNDE